MQIAEQVVKNGVSGSGAFLSKLQEIIAAYEITKVVETGTHVGTGTTRAVYDALRSSGRDFSFYSIEVNPEFHLQAVHNLPSDQRLMLLNGLSVGRPMLPVDTTFDVPDHIIVDHYPEHRNQMYLKEVSYNVPDNMLDYALSKFDYRPELVILDSAGHMGLIEFRYLMDRLKGEIVLALDDTFHVKHYDTMEYIRQNPKQFSIIWEVESEYMNAQSGSKFGSAIVRVS